MRAAPPRFTGEEPEPRAGVRGGHMPGAVNVHIPQLIARRRHLEAADELATMFAERGVDLAQPIVTTCGSGITAAILMLALDEIGRAAMWRSMTAPGRNGAAAPKRRW